MSRIVTEIPKSEHKYIKMCAHKLGISMKQFVMECVLRRVDELEDDWYIERRKEEGTWCVPLKNEMFVDWQESKNALELCKE